MKIHTDKITLADLYAATRDIPGAYLDDVAYAGSRSRDHAFWVSLESDGTPDQHGAPRRHKRNSGHRGAHPGYAASYADWGHWLAALFDIDPDAIASSYKGRDDFHAQTKGAFETEQPDDYGPTPEQEHAWDLREDDHR